jgi:hypothetical protein
MTTNFIFLLEYITKIQGNREGLELNEKDQSLT